MQIKYWRVVRRNTPIVVVLFAGIIFGLGLLMSLSGCTSKQQSQSALQEQQEQQELEDAQIIRNGIEAEFDVLKNLPPEQLSQYLESSDADSLAVLSQYGINYQELLTHLLGKMNYSIDEVAVEGDRAQATLTITNVNIDAALGNLDSTLNTPESIEEFGTHFRAEDDAAIMQAVMQRAYACIDESQEMVSTQVQLTLNKTDNAWSVDESSLYGLVSAVYGGFDFAALGI